jgi:hypothetical protein
MKQILKRVRQRFRKMEDRFDCFSRHELQVEGWLLGELITLLDKMQKKREIIGFDREITTVGNKRIDLAIDHKDARIWIELKHWLIGEQSGENWLPKDYVRELSHEFEKLEEARAGENGWIVVLCTRNPGQRAWEEGIRKFNDEFKPWALEAIDNPNDFSKKWYFGALKARGLKT